MGLSRFQRQSVGDALVALCTGSPIELADGEEVATSFLRAVTYHRLAPLAHVMLRDRYPELSEQFKPMRDHVLFHHLRVAATLERIGEQLHGVPWVVFKGPVLSESAHPVPGIRWYQDLDLLVAPQHLRAVCERLFAQGWQLRDTDAMLGDPSFGGEISLRSPWGTFIDLHWAMTNSAALRRKYPVPTADIIGRRVTVSVAGSEVPTLEHVDTVVYLCLHACLTGATRLLHLMDIDRLIRQVDDPDRIISRALSWEAAAPVALVLGRAHQLLGTPMPARLRRRLGLSAPFAWLMSVVDRGWPVSLVWSGSSMPRRIAMHVRPSALRTLAAVGAASAVRLATRFRRASRSEWMPASASGIDAYLSKVEAAAGTESEA